MRTPFAYTLLEFLVTVTIFTMSLTLAVPTFHNTYLNSRRQALVNEMVASIHYGKSESIKRLNEVVICGTDDGANCNQSDDWRYGWLIFSNFDGDEPPSIDAEDIILSYRQLDGKHYVNSNRNNYVFRAVRRRSTNGTIVFCDGRGPSEGRAVIISPTGRPRVSTTYADGDTLTC